MAPAPETVPLPDAHRERLAAFFGGRRCVVTGGAGFIGSHITDALVALGADVTVIDDLSNSSPAHVAGLIEQHPARVRFVLASILDDAGLEDAIDGASVVFHEAAVCSVPRSIKHPRRTWTVNATGTLRVLDAARDAGVHRVVYAASSSAYGNSPALPRVETALPQPLSPYAASKLAGEAALVSYAESYGLSTIGLRYFNIFGPRQRPGGPYAGVIPAFAERLAGGEPPLINGDGTQSRDFTHVANAVAANLLAAACEEPLTGHVVNVGAGESTTILDLASKMAGLWAGGHDQSQPAPVEFAPPRPGDVLHSVADVSAARRLLGYEPVVGFEDGLRETVAWLQHSLGSQPAHA